MGKDIFVKAVANRLRRERRRKLTRVVALRITEEEYNALLQYAKENNVDVSSVLRVALSSFLDGLVTLYKLKGEKNES